MHQEKYLCLGRKIAECRRQIGLSQKTLARRVGISPSYLGKLECGRGTEGTSLEVLYNIAAGLNMDADQLLRITKADIRLVHIFSLQRQQRLKQRINERRAAPAQLQAGRTDCLST